eukprot:786692_1
MILYGSRMEMDLCIFGRSLMAPSLIRLKYPGRNRIALFEVYVMRCVYMKILRAWKKTGGDAVHEVAYSGGAIKTLLSHETSLWSSSDDCFLSERNRDGVVVTQLKDMDKTSRCLVIDSNHGRLWSSSKTGIHVYDRKRGLIASLRGHQGELTALLAVDGDIWSGGSDKCICIWSAETFELRRKMKAHRRPMPLFVFGILRVANFENVSDVKIVYLDWCRRVSVEEFINHLPNNE